MTDAGLVIFLESPYGNGNPVFIAYAQRAMNDARRRGEIPIVSHLMWTQHEAAIGHFVSDDSEKYVVTGREAALDAICHLRLRSDKVVAYTDYGISAGMQHGLEHAKANGLTIEMRQLGSLTIDEANARARNTTSAQ